MWYIPEYIDVDSVDIYWTPPIDDVQPYVYHFLSQHTFTDSKRLDVGVSGVTYTVPGASAIKIVRDKKVIAKPLMSRWNVPTNIDSGNIDFTWHPNAFDPPYVYHFSSRHQRSSGLTYTVPGAVDIKFINHFVVQQIVPQIFYVDFLNPEGKEQFERLKAKYPNIKLTRYVDSHLNVLRRIVNQAESKFVWIISSICEYNDSFDFTWHPEHWQEEMIHVFSSGQQKRGDTFYINVDSFKTQQYDLEILDWFNVINYCKDQKVYRFKTPVVEYDSDDLIEQIKNYNFKFPYATFTNLEHGIMGEPDPCVWSEKDRVVQSWSPSNATCVVPKDVKVYLKTQVYDYPHIEKLNQKLMNRFIDPELDIVYISNGEPDAERWYKHLEKLLDREDPGFPTLRNKNLLHRVSGVNGRMAAYKAAAEKSTTPWFFAVFAKLEVAEDFDWNWQPDYWQEPKHYIFNARNPVNGLEYGHMGMIAYNKKLVLETIESGLDFTLSKAHEVVPILSGTAHFNQDAWTTWRTAFREVVKLKHFGTVSPTIETSHRLKKWLTVADGKFAEWCLKGATDAVEYYESVNGNYDKLMLTYEWDWLRTYYSAKY